MEFQRIKAELILAFQKDIGNGHYTLDSWIATIGIWMPPAVALRHLIPSTELATRELLLVLHFLKEYRVSAAACLSFNYRARSTIEEHVWRHLRVLDDFLPSFDPDRRFLFPRPGGVAEDALSTIDGTFCPRRSSSDADYRCDLIGKEKRTGWRYVLLTRTVDGEVLGYAGPVQGRSNDPTLSNTWHLLTSLLPWERVVADALWRYDPRFLTARHPLAEYDETDLEIRDWRTTVEHVIRFLKSFAILSVPFRHHDSERHELVFRVLCKLFNFCLPFEPVQIVCKPDLLYLDEAY